MATVSQHQRLRRKPKSRGALLVTHSTATPTQSAVEAKGAAGLVPGHRLDALGVEPLDPAVDGAAAAEQQRGDGDPGLAVVQEQEDMGAEADLGVGVLAIAVEECGPLLGVEVDAALHGCAGMWTRGRSTRFYAPRHFPVCWELFR